MKDNNINREISFILQNSENRTKTFKRGYYCFKSNISHICIFYSAMEDVWVAVLINGWIKINNRILGNEALALIEPQCIIEIDKEQYIFYSYTNQTKAASKVVTELISNADEKKVYKEDILFYLSNLRNILDLESYFEILMQNPVFERDENGLIKMNYFIYGLYRYYDIRFLLLAEFKYYMNIGKMFYIIEFQNFFCNSSTYDYLQKNLFKCKNGTYTIPEYLYDLVGHFYIDRLRYPDCETFEICRIWKSYYDLGDQYNTPNLKKIKIDIFEDFNIKKCCKSDEHSGEKISQFHDVPVYMEMNLLRNCFKGIGRTHKRDRKQKKRSHSLVEDRGSINDKVWMFEKRPNDI
ncbi:hypothetical protein NCER_102010 [Vairimorpha ceranae BRL01]|uniref:Uncharacterized protein n=2 Tax=Vairimorpha ceranae TaxID=40302 RepID=C4VB77_VAIC1|nr:hypothetical protein AAJ76_1700026052 [Vairimorpha ceranae]EEQ81526.1 hypothetical protein NCER_102010 [Vairimorpha ceranae BRL01]KAF5140885.1 hypothetical protein G9O61_00g008750 [Vairimorpha ceranae]KKO75578.1 hypothetical protein AAJ76_1700026052 [Vairimorpha ceranae]